MRGNTNPCSVCKYCDDSCDVCLHQPYEHTIAARYCEASSSDEEGDTWGGYASTDVDSASDEEGSWFTTPWSQLITQRVAGYEVDPAIGVQLAPLEGDEDNEDGGDEEKHEQRAKEERHRRRAAAQEEDGEDGVKTRGRGRRLRRRRRRLRGDSPAAAPEPTATAEVAVEAASGVPEDAAEAAQKVAEVVANGEVPAASPDGTEPAANDEVWALFSDGGAQPASAQVREEGDDATVPKDTPHNNMWRATVHSYASVVSVS